MLHAIGNDETRRLIVSHYNDIVREEKMLYTKTNKTVALKLMQGGLHDKEFFIVRQRRWGKGDADSNNGGYKDRDSEKMARNKEKRGGDLSVSNSL